MGRPRKEEKKEGKIEFFSEIDLNDNGKIRSDMPAWYFEYHIDELRETIFRKKSAIERGEIAPDQVMMLKEELIKEEEKLKEIEGGKPKLTPDQKDCAYNMYESLKKQIRDTLPTIRENALGLISPHEELKRQKTKHISVNTELAKACGVSSVHGKISGDEANKCFKILGKALGESTNVERLRREGSSEAYRSMHDLTQAILEGKPVGKVDSV